MRSRLAFAVFVSVLTTSAFGATNITVSTSATSGGSFVGGTFTLAGNPSTANVNNTDIKNLLDAGTSVIIDTTSLGGGQGFIDVGADIRKTAGGDASLTLRATDAILFAIGTGVTSTSNKLNVELNSDRDASGDGAIQLADGSTIVTNDGNLTLGGGANPLTTAASGQFGVVSTQSGVFIRISQLNAGTGAISIRGRGENASESRGVFLQVSIVTSTSGSITIDGEGGSGPATNPGVYSVNATISSTSGTIQLTGRGGPTATGNGNIGVDVDGETSITSATGSILITGQATANNSGSNQTGVSLAYSTISSTGAAGAATITINGTGGSGPAGNNPGVTSSGTTSITSVDADIVITGTGGSGAAVNRGISMAFGATVTSSGTSADAAKITLNGTGGPGLISNDGIVFSGTMTSVAGAISLTGTSPSATTNVNSGVTVASGTIRSTGTGPSAAPITINGTGAPGQGANRGIYLITNALVTSIDGAIQMTGQGGAGTLNDNSGIRIETNSTVSSTGTGPTAASITLQGTGGSGSGLNAGVVLNNVGTVATVDGDIQITGVAGTGTNAATECIGVRLESNSFVRSTGTGGSAGNITLNGTGGSSQTGNSGVRFGSSSVTAVDGSIVITGQGGTNGNFNHGLSVFNSVLTASGVAPLIINGTAGAGGLSFGITVTSSTFGTGGAATLTGSPIEVSGGTVNFGTLTFNAAGLVAIAETSDTVLAGSNMANPLNLTSGGTISDAGATSLVVGGNATITGATGISLANDGGDVLSIAGLASFSETVLGSGISILSPGSANFGTLRATSQAPTTIFEDSATGLSGASSSATTFAITSSGAITDAGAAFLTVAAPLTLSAASGGIGVLGTPIRFDAGSLATFSGGNANQFLQESNTAIVAGSGLNAGSGTIQLSGGTLTLSASDLINDATSLVITAGAIDVATFNDTIALLSLQGGAANGSGGTLTVNSTIDAQSGSASARLGGTNGLLKTTAGTVTLSGANTYSGATVINGGTLLVNGSLSAGSAVTVNAGGTLGGSGTINGTVTANTGANVSPGQSPGILSTGSIALANGSTATFEINGPTVGTEYDQINVTGTVTLNTPTLALIGTIAAPPATPIVIINNDGTDPVVGTFAGLPNGSAVTVNGIPFHIFYDRGTGNDVVLLSNLLVTPAINIVKLTNATDNDTPPGVFVPVGSTVTFTYLVTNPGTEMLMGISVLDDSGTPAVPADDFTPTFVGGDANSNGLLDTTETWTYTATRVATAGQYTNIATASATDVTLGQTVTDSNADNHFGATVSIDLTKRTNGTNNNAAPGPLLPAGSTATFTYTVTNGGNVALSGVTVRDDNGTAGTLADDFNATFVGGDANANVLLDTTETWTFTANRIVTAGQYTNVGTATGTPPPGAGAAAVDSDADNHFGVQAGIGLVKRTNGTDNDTAPGVFVLPGSTVTFTYTVTNSGNVALSAVTVIDDNGTAGTPGDDFSATFTGGDTNANGILDLTETWTFTASRIATLGQHTNIGMATGTPPVGAPVTATNPDNHFGSNSAVNLVLLTNGSDNPSSPGVVIPVGGTATFTYNVTNPGNSALSAVTIVDDNGTPGNTADDFAPTFTGGDADADGLLDTTETWTFTASRTVTFGPFTNTATVTATPPPGGGPNVTDSDVDNHFGGTVAQIPTMDEWVLLLLAAVLAVAAVGKLKS